LREKLSLQSEFLRYLQSEKFLRFFEPARKIILKQNSEDFMKKLLVLPLIAMTLYSCISIPFSGRMEPLSEIELQKGSNNKILVINIYGTIQDSEKKGSLMGPAEMNISARISEELEKAAEDSSIKAIILRIDSPGGSVTTCDIIHNLIIEHKKKYGTYVVAHMGSVAASGGYYLSVTADRIIAHPTTVTGSIGVVAVMVNIEGLLEKIGVADQTLKSGAAKTMGSPLHRMTKTERHLFQKIIDALYERFISVILESRSSMTPESLLAIADGRVMIANDALESGLIDQIGYWQTAINTAAKGAGISDPTVITYRRPGEYHPNAFTIENRKQQPNFSLIPVDSSLFFNKYGVSFMYLWKM
jgi:protease-4